jgi:hypothetical protein
MQNSHVLPVVQAEVIMETSVLRTFFYLKKSLDFCLSFNLVWADVPMDKQFFCCVCSMSHNCCPCYKVNLTGTS